MNLDLSYIHGGLKAKWFRIETKGNDYFCRFYINGEKKTKIRSKVGGFSKKKYKTYPKRYLTLLYRYLYFDSKKQLFEFFKCPFTKEDYQEMLSRKGKIKKFNS